MVQKSQEIVNAVEAGAHFTFNVTQFYINITLNINIAIFS